MLWVISSPATCMADTIRYEMQLRRRRAKRAKESQREARNERLAFGFSCFFARSLAPASTRLNSTRARARFFFTPHSFFFKERARALFISLLSFILHAAMQGCTLCTYSLYSLYCLYSTTPNEMHTFTFLRIASLKVPGPIMKRFFRGTRTLP